MYSRDNFKLKHSHDMFIWKDKGVEEVGWVYESRDD